MKQDLDFFTLLMNRLGNQTLDKNISLLYRASENEYSALKFHESCDDWR